MKNSLRTWPKQPLELLLSFWRDEAAAAVRDYGLMQRDEAPPDSRAMHG